MKSTMYLPLNSYKDKETTEWSNFWYDQANVQGGGRILLVGNSIARQYRRSLSEKLKCPVDLFGTSAALRDSMFWDQWQCFFKNGLYEYSTIFCWVGNHSRLNEDGNAFFGEQDYRRLYHDFTRLIIECKSRTRQVVVLSTFHIYKWRKYNNEIERIRRKLGFKPKEYLNDEENVVVENKNRIMKEISEEHNLPFYDIDAIMMKSKYWHVDFIHYIPESNSFVAEYLCRLLV